MRWRMAAAVVLAAVLAPWSALAAGPASAQQPPPAPAPAAAPDKGGEVQTYMHPVRRYLMPVPQGAHVAEPDPSRVVIDSRQGFRIIVQTNDANPNVPLQNLNDKFEAQYLGHGKPLSLKLDEHASELAGLDAVEAKYEGAGSIARLVMARGAKTDFVFMFFAPRDRFEALGPQFQWLLDNFRPNPADLPEYAGAPTVRVAPAAPAKPVAKAKRFAEAGYGYAIQYPGDWQVGTPSATIATFSGPEGTDAYFAVVSIQNVQPPSATSARQATQAAIADHKAILQREARDLVVHGEQPLTYKNGRLTLAGMQMLVSYSFGGERYRRWTIVVPRPTGTVTHVWSYTAPEAKFDIFRPIADAMLKSWTIQPDRPAGGQ